MKTHDLVKRLAAEAAPVTPLPSRTSTTLGFALFAVAGVLAPLFFSQVRGDARSLGVAVEVTLVAAALLSTWTLALFAVPGRSDFRRTAFAAMAFFLAAAVALVVNGMSGGIDAGTAEAGLECTISMVSLSIVPTVFIFWRLRRAAPVRPALTGALAALSVGLFATFAQRLCCPNDHGMHLFGWHLCVPLAILGIAGALAGRRFLRW